MPQTDNNTYFPNYDESGYEQIASWTPTFYQDIKEADANMRFAGYTADEMGLALEKFCNNMFIDTMDESVVKRMEIFFHLDGTGRTIDERKKAIKAAQAGSGHMSTDRVKKIIGAFTGKDCDVSFRDIYRIFADVTGTNKLQRDDMRATMAKQMPAHIMFEIRCHEKYVEEIDESKLEEIKVERIRFQIPLPFWRDCVFNGLWILDGNVILSCIKSYSPILALKTRISIFDSKESLKLFLSVLNAFIKNDGKFESSTQFKLSSKTNSFLNLGMNNNICICDAREKIDVTVITKSRDCWFFDGAVNFDGSMSLNSIYRKEVVG